MKKERIILLIIIITIVLILLTIILYLLFFITKTNIPINKTTNCTNYPYYNCPPSCVVCPPCEVCSSLRCNTEEFCNSIGFNETWYKNIKNRIILS